MYRCVCTAFFTICHGKTFSSNPNGRLLDTTTVSWIMFNTITYIEYIRYTLLSHYTLFHFYLDSNKDIGYLKVHTHKHTQKVHFLVQKL